MKFYYCKSACSLVTRIVLNELSLPFEEEAVDLKTKKTASGEDFLAINPKGAVPALRLENGTILTEGQVILQYLADNTPRQALLAPIGDLKRYETLECMNYIVTELHKLFGMLFNPSLAEMIKPKLMPMILERFAYLNQRLAKGTYLMGNYFTLPDAYLFVMLQWAGRFDMDLSANQYLEPFKKRVQERPAVIKSLQQEK